MARTRPWEVSDELWEHVHPLIPPRPAHPKGGRPAADDRQMFAAMVYVLRTGIQWNALPRELGASSTVYDRFRNWEAQGFFQRLWQAELQHYDELQGIAWDWQSVDSSTVKAPFAQAASVRQTAPVLSLAAHGSVALPGVWSLVLWEFPFLWADGCPFGTASWKASSSEMV